MNDSKLLADFSLSCFSRSLIVKSWSLACEQSRNWRQQVPLTEYHTIYTCACTQLQQVSNYHSFNPPFLEEGDRWRNNKQQRTQSSTLYQTQSIDYLKPETLFDSRNPAESITICITLLWLRLFPLPLRSLLDWEPPVGRLLQSQNTDTTKLPTYTSEIFSFGSLQAVAKDRKLISKTRRLLQAMMPNFHSKHISLRE